MCFECEHINNILLCKGGKLWLFEVQIKSSWDLLGTEVQSSLAINSSSLVRTVFNQNFSITNLNAAAGMSSLLIVFCFLVVWMF